MTQEKPYPIAPKGLATSFTETELPPRYAAAFKNRFTNAAGGAEKRQGMVQLGSDVPSIPKLDNAHELIKPNGEEILFVSGDGKIYQYLEDTQTYAKRHTFNDTSATIKSLQVGGSLIFYNGVDRNVYTQYDPERNFEVLRVDQNFPLIEATLERSTAGTGTTHTVLHDAEVSSWTLQTNVAINDVVHNITRGGYGIINAVTTASAGHTEISPNATGIGIASGSAASGDLYEIIDTIELNVIPTSDPLGPDNTFTGGVGTSATGVVASAVTSWTGSEVRVGDYIRNTTRGALTAVTAISSAALRCHGVTGQTDGDSFILVKSAMPIATDIHQHFGWTYYVDARDKSRVRVAGPNNPRDFYNGGTLDTDTVLFGHFQSEGDQVKQITSYQRFLAIGGQRSVYYFDGVTPVSGDAGASDFSIRGIFPQGLVSTRGMLSLGDDAVFISQDGVETVAQTEDSSTLGRSDTSHPLSSTIRDLIAATPEAQIQLTHYRRRHWLLVKVGSALYVYNYTPYFGMDRLSSKYGGGTITQSRGAWHEFDGKLARSNAFYVRANGDLLCLADAGKVYLFDQGTYDDDGETYDTEYKTGWLTMDEPKRSVKHKRGKYIKVYTKTGAEVSYTITADAGMTRLSSETITVTAKGGDAAIGVGAVGSAAIGESAGLDDDKHALRWAGEQAQFTFKTSDTKGPDILSRFVIYVTEQGKR